MSKLFRKLQVFTKSADFRAATKVVEAALEQPKPDQIRVKNIYAGVNATDINITAGRYFTDGKLPFDIGLEAVGVVDAIGNEVTSNTIKVGEPVLVMSRNKYQGFSEYLYHDAKELVPLPELKPNFLVSFVNGLTASIGLDKAGRIQKGEKVLITSAAGGTGQIAVQWAKQRGCYVIATTSSEEKSAYLKELGVDFIINYRKDDLDKVLTENFPDGIDVVWETVGGQTFKTLFKHLARKGRLVIIGSIVDYKEKGIAGEPIDNLQAVLLSGSKSLNGFILFDFVDYYGEYLSKLIPMIHQGTLKAKVDLGESSEGGKFFGVDQVVRAEEHLHSGKNVGKVVVQIQEP